MIASRNRPLRGLVLALDGVLVVASIALAGGLHAALRDHFAVFKEPPPFHQYAALVFLTIPLWLVVTATIGLHRTFERVWTRAELAWDLIKLHAVGLVGLALIAFLTRTTINRSLVLLFQGSSFLLSYAVRSGLAYWQTYQHASGQTRTRLLLVGDDSPKVQAFIDRTAKSSRPPLIVGSLGQGEIAGLARLGSLTDLERVLHEQALEHVVFFPPFDRATIQTALPACDLVGVSAEVSIEISHPAKAPPRILDMFGLPFVSFDTAPKPLHKLALKHTFDWFASLLGLIVLAPVFLVVSIAILVTMGRPVFFTQTRAGLFGRQFRMIKFRSMVKDAEAQQAALADKNEMAGPVFKVTGDPRITRLGALLRKTSIDELPQLVNVFLGQMSLVGPRPLPSKEQQAIRGWHRRRLSMKPGITGVWQVSGRNNIDFEEWMRLDQQYVDEWSLSLDFKILLKTIPVVLLGRGAR